MSTTEHRLHGAADALPLGAAATPRLHLALLTTAEKASFEAGLRTRIFTRVLDALQAPTAGVYAERRQSHVALYVHLVEVLAQEAKYAGEPVTEGDVIHALDRVERFLGESRRHRLEQAINTSHVGSKMAARLNERADGAELDVGQALVGFTRWMSGWILLNWSVECVFAAVDQRMHVEAEVLNAVFADLAKAADDIYCAACELHDARFGDPDDEPGDDE